MPAFESLVTYTYEDGVPLKHAASILITTTLVLYFFGGYWAVQIGVVWPIILVAWVFWKTWNYLTYDNIGAKSDDEHLPARFILSIIPALACLFVYLVGYWAGSREWWWLVVLLGLVYRGVFKVIQKPY